VNIIAGGSPHLPIITSPVQRWAISLGRWVILKFFSMKIFKWNWSISRLLPECLLYSEKFQFIYYLL